MIISTEPQVMLLDYMSSYGAAFAARTCISEDGPTKIDQWLNERPEEYQRELVGRVVGYGHKSIAEFLEFTFGISGINLATSHQLVRHRIAEYAQKSQRYVKHTGLRVSVPENFVDERILDHFEAAFDLYEALLAEGVPAEDARLVLPQAGETNIVVKMNGRELLNFFAQRECTCAQKQIRQVAHKMHDIVNNLFPEVYVDAGPKCLELGRCTEMKSKNCGYYKKSKYYVEQT